MSMLTEIKYTIIHGGRAKNVGSLSFYLLWKTAVLHSTEHEKTYIHQCMHSHVQNYIYANFSIL